MPRVQVEIDEEELEEIKAIMAETKIRTLSAFLLETFNLYRCLFRERHAGRILTALNEATKESRQIVVPSLERVAPPDLEHEGTWNAAIRQVRSLGDARFKAEQERMRRLGILDKDGNPLSEEWPADMKKGSKTDVAT